MKLTLLLSSVAAVSASVSCSGGCGSAMQVNGVIDCYCHSLCLLEQPGPCCDDFEQMCPTQFAEGQAELLAAEEEADEASTVEALAPQLPQGCSLPGSNIIPVPDASYVWTEVGSTCKDHCGSSMVDQSNAVVCYCDSGCLLTADCCPDFIAVCEPDPCVLALVTPGDAELTAPEWNLGSCLNACGTIVPDTEANSFCSCEKACQEDGSCCDDFTDRCPALVDATLLPSTAAPQLGSCKSKCGGGSGACWCDYQCVQSGDCCEDYVEQCGSQFGLVMWTGLGSCLDKCGGAGFDCWCDEKCEFSGDCCDDYLQKCKSPK